MHAWSGMTDIVMYLACDCSACCATALLFFVLYLAGYHLHNAYDTTGNVRVKGI